MKLLRTSFLTAIGLALLGGALSLTYQKGVEAQAGSVPVRVVNTALAPALARDVDHREPYQATATANTTDNEVMVTLAAVPAGKRLVIEYVSVRAVVPIGQLVEGELGAPSRLLMLEMPFQSREAFIGRDSYVGSQKVLAFADAGLVPAVHVFRSANDGRMDAEAMVAGYLVDP